LIADPIVKRIAQNTGRSAEEVYALIQARWYRRLAHRLALWFNDHQSERTRW